MRPYFHSDPDVAEALARLERLEMELWSPANRYKEELAEDRWFVEKAITGVRSIGMSRQRQRVNARKIVRLAKNAAIAETTRRRIEAMDERKPGERVWEFWLTERDGKRRRLRAGTHVEAHALRARLLRQHPLSEATEPVEIGQELDDFQSGVKALASWYKKGTRHDIFQPGNPMPIDSFVTAREALHVGGRLGTDGVYQSLRTFARSQEKLRVVEHHGETHVTVMNARGETLKVERRKLRGKTVGHATPEPKQDPRDEHRHAGSCRIGQRSDLTGCVPAGKSHCGCGGSCGKCRAVVKHLSGYIEKATDGMTFEAVLSSSRPDREHDVVLPEGCRYDGVSVPLLIEHRHDMLPIGLVKNIRPSKGRLLGTVVFADSAIGRETAHLARKGFVKGLSLGFDPLTRPESRANGGKLYRDFEVLEVSVVAVPSQPDAKICNGPC
jgi:HK97 family phage prohead protease